MCFNEKKCKIELNFVFWKENKIIIKMQTRSQTRKLLNDPKNEMFEIPVVKAAERPTVRPTTERPTVRPTVRPTTERPTVRPTTERPTVRPTTERPTVRPTTVRPTVRPTTTKVSARVLPDSIINGPSTPINCALFLPKYIQKPVYEVDIDFDEASEAWRSNKTSIGNGQYKYNKGTRCIQRSLRLKIPY